MGVTGREIRDGREREQGKGWEVMRMGVGSVLGGKAGCGSGSSWDWCLREWETGPVGVVKWCMECERVVTFIFIYLFFKFVF
jgi:hypothetical protein